MQITTLSDLHKAVADAERAQKSFAQVWKIDCHAKEITSYGICRYREGGLYYVSQTTYLGDIETFDDFSLGLECFTTFESALNFALELEIKETSTNE